MLVALVFRYIFAFRLFSEVWLLTQGGPARLTEVLAVYLYKQSFTYNQFGLASAAGWVMVVLSGLIAALYMRLIYRNMFAERGRRDDARFLRLAGRGRSCCCGRASRSCSSCCRRSSRRATSSSTRRSGCSSRPSSTMSSSGGSGRSFFGYLQNSLIIATLRDAARGRRRTLAGFVYSRYRSRAPDRLGLLPDRRAPAAADRHHPAAVPDGRLPRPQRHAFPAGRALRDLLRLAEHGDHEGVHRRHPARARRCRAGSMAPPSCRHCSG